MKSCHNAVWYHGVGHNEDGTLEAKNTDLERTMFEQHVKGKGKQLDVPLTTAAHNIQK